MSFPSQGFSSNLYPGFKLHHIGNWQLQWWGMQWSLTHKEIEEVIKEIEAEKNYMSINYQQIDTFLDGMKKAISHQQNSDNVSFGSKIFTGFLGIMSNFSQTNESSYEYLKRKIQDCDLGNGVIIDLSGKYSNQLENALIILNSGKIYSR